MESQMRIIICDDNIEFAKELSLLLKNFFNIKGIKAPEIVSPVVKAPVMKVPVMKKLPIKMPPGMVKIPKMPGVVRVKIPKALHQAGVPPTQPPSDK